VSLESAMTRVMVIASSAVSQAGLESLLKLSQSVEIVEAVSKFSNSWGWMQVLELDTADILLVEGVREQSIIQALSEFAAEETMPVIVVLPHAVIERRFLVQMLNLGIRGLLPYSASATEIVAAIRAVASGLTVFHADFQRDLFDESLGFGSDVDEGKIEPLTSREQEVLTLLSQGFSNKAIAAELHLSEHTIKFHIGAIFNKLNASSRTEAVTIGMRQGFIML
jgi:two-component system, NarL family, response regulator YdfI